MAQHGFADLGFTVDLPDGSLPQAETSAGPRTAQFGLPGGILLTVVPREPAVRSFADAVGWANLLAEPYLASGAVAASGTLGIEGADTFAKAVVYDGADGAPCAAATVALRFPDGRFIGLVVLWPVVQAEREPRLDMLREVAARVRPLAGG
jgi:hypothetical protein